MNLFDDPVEAFLVASIDIADFLVDRGQFGRLHRQLPLPRCVDELVARGLVVGTHFLQFGANGGPAGVHEFLGQDQFIGIDRAEFGIAHRDGNACGASGMNDIFIARRGHHATGLDLQLGAGRQDDLSGVLAIGKDVDGDLRARSRRPGASHEWQRGCRDGQAETPCCSHDAPCRLFGPIMP